MVGGVTQSHSDLRFHLPNSFIPFVPTRSRCWRGTLRHFELQKSLFPDCVQTCRDVPPGSLPSPFLPRAPSFPFPSPTACLCIPAPTIIPLQSQGKSYTGRQEVCGVYGIEGSCTLPLTHNCNCSRAAAGTEQKIIIIPSEPHNLNSGSRV